MPLNPDFVGRSFPPSEPYEVGREHIREFAAAIGDTHPAYRDAAAARALGHSDVIAPPTFLTVVAFRRPNAAIADPDLGLDYSRLVHGEQRFTHHRPVVAGDRLVSTSTITDIRVAGRNELMTITSEITTEAGEPVSTVTNVVVIRGTAPVQAG
ncbi:MAG TPA: MaoC family dehydratase N-terminal domain-containing protein [Mycobacteriales bacterium]|nr:MaoC family dehydratase N-terminal domain-containing protein [Mycobacteriales bacterium]